MPFPLPLLPFERLMWRDNRPHYPQMFPVVLRFSGRLDAERLTRSLAWARRFQPLLQAVITGEGRRARWVHLPDVATAVHWAQGRADVPFPAPIDPCRDAGLRVVGFHERNPAAALDTTTLAFEFHHACVDGVGAVQFLGDALWAYQRLSADESLPTTLPRPLDTERLAAQRRPITGLRYSLQLALRSPAMLFCLGKLLGYRTSSLATDDRRAVEGQYPQRDSMPPLALPSERLEADVTARLRALAAAAGCTLNDLLLAEHFQTIAQWNTDHRGGGPRLRVIMPANRRGDANHALPAVNCVDCETIDRPQNECGDFARLLASLRDETRRIKARQGPCALNQSLELLSAAPRALDRLLQSRGTMFTSILSNLGEPAARWWPQLDRDADGAVSVGEARLETLAFAPPVRPRSRVAIGVVRYRGGLSLLGQGCPFTIGLPGLSEFLKLYADRLRRRSLGPAEQVHPPGVTRGPHARQAPAGASRSDRATV